MPTQVITYADDIRKIEDSLRIYAEEFGRPFPNPAYSSVHKRQEFTLNYQASSNNSAMAEINVVPEHSVNIILDDVSGVLKVFSKVEGEIFVTVTYADGSSETEQITSRRGDAKL